MGISGQQETTARSTGRSLRRGLLAVSATGLLVLTGCGDRDDDPQPAVSEEGPVLVGAGPTVQTQAVADAWVLALEDSGIAAEVREVEGGRAGYLQAVEDGTVPDDSQGDTGEATNGSERTGPGRIDSESGTDLDRTW